MGKPEFTTTVDKIVRGKPAREYPNALPEVRQSQYSHQVIKPKLLHRPWLEILDQFLDPEETGFAAPLEHRLFWFDVQVIHILASGEIHPESPIDCKNAAEFNKAIGFTDKALSGTLVMAEDISQAMVDVLGMQYNIDPEFFACHLHGTETFRTGEWKSSTSRAPNVLPDYLRKSSFYTAETWRPCNVIGARKKLVELRSCQRIIKKRGFLGSVLSALRVVWESSDNKGIPIGIPAKLGGRVLTNTPRGALVLWDDTPDMFINEKISVYERKSSRLGMTSS